MTKAERREFNALLTAGMPKADVDMVRLYYRLGRIQERDDDAKIRTIPIDQLGGASETLTAREWYTVEVVDK